jgi:zona occludens toxin
MIELQTGLPGACKSLYTIDRIEVLRQQTKRPVFYVKREQGDDTAPGIVELTLPWTPITVEQWPDCPPGSIVVIDECQKVPGFRPRPTSQAAPVWCEPAMETHRGKGIDLVLICQHPSQLHVGIRRLVGRHLHAVRKFGMQVSTVHEWGATKDTCDKTRTDSIKHLYKFNKQAYKYYKSAEAHTHKAKLPAKIYILGALIVLVPVLGYFGLKSALSISQSSGPGQIERLSQGVGGPPGASAGQQPRPQDQAMTPLEYAQSYQPRIEGLAHTAPAYDEVTRPQQAPYPAACIASKTRCGCWTQQGTKLATPEDLCRSIADGGFFVAWAGVAVPAQPLEPARKEPASVSQ